MSLVVNTKQQELEPNSKAAPQAVAASRKQKAPGTRVGTAEDWRSGDTKGTREKSGRGKALRDGR